MSALLDLSRQPRSWRDSVGQAGFAAGKEEDGGKVKSIFQQETNRMPEYTGRRGRGLKTHEKINSWHNWKSLNHIIKIKQSGCIREITILISPI